MIAAAHAGTSRTVSTKFARNLRDCRRALADAIPLHHDRCGNKQMAKDSAEQSRANGVTIDETIARQPHGTIASGRPSRRNAGQDKATGYELDTAQNKA
jgi:hypothetical protein